MTRIAFDKRVWSELGPQQARAAAFFNFMEERHNIYVRRNKDRRPWPWTEDAILRQYRFCNVYRELDTVTVWVRQNIREPFADHPNLWFMLCAARQINWPDTLQELMADRRAWPHAKSLSQWDPERMRTIMNDRKARGEQVYTGAYMLTNVLDRASPQPHDKPWFTAHRVLGSVRDRAAEVTAALPQGMEAVHKVLAGGYGWGGFTAYEVVCDLRWTPVGRKWLDINSFANAGPGAVRGLNRVWGRPLKQALRPDAALSEMRELLRVAPGYWPKPSVRWPKLELREIEHSLCEFDKYERVRLGEGRPRSLYTPSQHSL